MIKRVDVFLRLSACIMVIFWFGLFSFAHPAYGQESANAQGTSGKDGSGINGRNGKNKVDTGSASSPASNSAKSAPSSGSIQFVDLELPANQQKPKLPYGQSFTISGDVEDVCITGKAQRDKTTNAISCGTGGQKLTEILAATKVGGKYTVSGQDTQYATSTLSGNSWSVTVGKLEENTPVTFKFSFSGTLSQSEATIVADQLLTSEDFVSALDQFLSAARGKSPSEQAVFASALGQTTGQKVLELISALHVSPTNADEFRKLLASPSLSTFGLFVNLPAELDSLSHLPPEDKQKLDIQDNMTPSSLYKSIGAALKANTIDNASLKTTAQRFVASYEALRNQLSIDVAANLSVDVGTTADDISEDLQKYAGFDVGAFYVPRLDELRSFATVSIYFGSVSLQPSNGIRSKFMERISLTFGVALKDLSGSDPSKSKIRGENAFAYGVGFRLNKYFRITTGGIVYRAQLPALSGTTSPTIGGLHNTIFIGPSIDVTALPALKGIFAKAKSN